MNVPDRTSFSVGNHTIVGNLRTSLVKSTSHFILAAHPTITAPSGSIQSLQILFNSSFTK
jgi:hypothetical protein